MKQAKNSLSRPITQSAIIGGIYAALTIVLAPWSYGPVQVRVAEALTVLPYLYPQAIPGLFVGCMLANIVGGYGPIDIFGGSLLTLLAGLTTYWLARLKKPWLAPIPPVAFNAFGVGLILHVAAGAPYWLTVLYVGMGQTIACFGLGLPLLYAIRRRYQQIGS